MTKAPDRIYLQWNPSFLEDDELPLEDEDVTWCRDDVHGNDIPYVKAEGDDEMRRFHNRVRIIWNLPEDAFPKAERELNPTAWAFWKGGRETRIKAFLHASDAIAESIWQAVLDYEAGKS